MPHDIKDIYSRVTARIVADLEQGVRPWMKPWSGEHAAGRITRPLRHNGIPYKGINVVMLWSAATEKGYSCPLWLTFRQALELGGNVRKGETGELVVYANRITRTETDDTGAESEREIPFLKGYTVFNAEQCDGLPPQFQTPAAPPALSPLARIDHADAFFAATGADIRHGGTRAFYAEGPDYVAMPPLRDLPRRREPCQHPRPRAYPLDQAPAPSRPGFRGDLGGARVMPRRNSSPSWDRPSSRPTSPLPRRFNPTMPPISRPG